MCINRGTTRSMWFLFFGQGLKRNVHREHLEGNFCYQCNILQREAPEMAHWLSPRRSLVHPARCLLVHTQYNLIHSKVEQKSLYVTCTASEFVRPPEEHLTDNCFAFNTAALLSSRLRRFTSSFIVFLVTFKQVFVQSCSIIGAFVSVNRTIFFCEKYNVFFHY